MIGLKNTFEPSSLENWISQLKRDLKEDDFLKLQKHDLIEEINFSSYLHSESNKISIQVPGKFPFTRGNKILDNKWNNGFEITVIDENSANSKALSILMKGCDFIIFNLNGTEAKDWSILLNEIQLDYLKIQIRLNSRIQFESLRSHFGNNFPSTLSLSIDFMVLEDSDHLFESIANHCKDTTMPFCNVNGFSIQQCGATTWQEIGFCMATAHEYLVKLINSGLSADQAAKCIVFSIGIGSNYFLEIAKIRALRQGWATILKQYNPKHSDSYSCEIIAEIGYMNKSLQDPYTNLLRQTTEAMAAISGGVDGIIIHPFDAHSFHGSTNLSERMALNISLILKEESYFEAVIDPMGGSYMIEDLTDKIGLKAWQLFQEIEDEGGIASKSGLNDFKIQVEKKAVIRKERIATNRDTLIGINKYCIQKPEENYFLNSPKYLDMETLVFERELISAK